MATRSAVEPRYSLVVIPLHLRTPNMMKLSDYGIFNTDVWGQAAWEASAAARAGSAKGKEEKTKSKHGTVQDPASWNIKANKNGFTAVHPKTGATFHEKTIEAIHQRLRSLAGAGAPKSGVPNTKTLRSMTRSAGGTQAREHFSSNIPSLKVLKSIKRATGG